MKFVVCGEALIDLVPETQCSTFASTWQAQSAGGPMNTAIALARLGENVEFCGRISRDAFGCQIAEHLAENHVGAAHLVRTDDPTSLAVVSLDEQGKASYAFHFSGTSNFGWGAEELTAPAEGSWLHVASLALVVPPSNQVLLEWARNHRGPMSIDVNVRPTVIPDRQEYWRRIQPWFEVLGEHAGVLKASDEDLVFLARGAGMEPDPLEAARRWSDQFGFSLAVTTLGPDGAVAQRTGQPDITVPGERIELADTIGAGDTFMGAFLRAHANDPADLAGSLQEAVVASALVCERHGAQPPTGAELSDRLRR